MEETVNPFRPPLITFYLDWSGLIFIFGVLLIFGIWMRVKTPFRGEGNHIYPEEAVKWALSLRKGLWSQAIVTGVFALIYVGSHLLQRHFAAFLISIFNLLLYAGCVTQIALQVWITVCCFDLAENMGHKKHLSFLALFGPLGWIYAAIYLEWQRKRYSWAREDAAIRELNRRISG